jgi:hypothetical protein
MGGLSHGDGIRVFVADYFEDSTVAPQPLDMTKNQARALRDSIDRLIRILPDR